MPDKRSVTVGFRSRQEGSETQQYTLPGELYRLHGGWTLVYREAPDENGVETINTLFVHAHELRLRRRGSILVELSFRQGASLPGKMETPYGPHDVEASTSYLRIGLSESGGVVEWKYDLLMQDQTVGSFHIRLDIREEQAE
ncbi:DUF1934 domain-containing protein [Cohnella cholangitidis]|uniref:DUF1934 domain-containing protein n=1 Tax=Cohnella cholangitidis TaxID=2598458 RepID=A0A7G5C036_9BACL|nr:DUF1934 domain-containing protein [Cohnella cholangitidis]QMV42570.1 DUF1934 domain-containing protein [Cohnella cholangitidis]